MSVSARISLETARTMENSVSPLLEVTWGIRQLHARYADAVWRKDYDAYADCWTDDAEWLIAGQTFRGKTEITSAFSGFMSKYKCVLFSPRKPIVHISGSEISARTYVTEKNKLKTGGYVSSIATYFERFSESGGVLRRRWAFLQVHFIGSADLDGTFFEQADFGIPPAMPPSDALARGHFESPPAAGRE
jgi:SnoaL-like domain